MQGIDNSKKVLGDLGDMVCAAIHAVHGGGIKEIYKAVKEVAALVSDAKAALPELKDLSGAEAVQLTEAAYEMLLRIVQCAA